MKGESSHFFPPSSHSSPSAQAVRHELVLLPAKACLSLSIEADVYIDYIAVRSTQVTQRPCLSTPFLTSAAPFLFQAFIVVDAGDSVASITPTPDPMDESASLFLCTFRSQSDQNQRRL